MDDEATQLEVDLSVLVELPDRRGLLRFPYLTAALNSRLIPSHARVWSGPQIFAGNASYHDWVDYVRPTRPDLCVEDGPHTHSQAWVAENIYPILLELAQTPEQYGSTIGEAQEEAEMAKAGKKRAAAPEKAAGERTYGKLNLDAKIKLLVDKNPKREGTEGHKRFALYKSGMLVSTYLEKGGWRADVPYDVKKGFVKLEE